MRVEYGLEGLEILRRGQWGFSFQIPASAYGVFGPGQRFETDILSVNETPPYERWTVVLNCMRYSGGTLIVAGQPADNQVDSRWGARIEWGSNQAADGADVDWPCRGGSFVVSADYLRLKVFRDAGGPAIGPSPILSGYVSTTSRVVTAVVPPTRTKQITLLSLGSGLMSVPERAIAYRLSLGAAGDVLGSVIQLQGDGASGAQVDGLAITNAGTETFQQNRWAYRPLLAATEFLQFTTTAGNVATVNVSFMLDLG